VPFVQIPSYWQKKVLPFFGRNFVQRYKKEAFSSLLFSVDKSCRSFYTAEKLRLRHFLGEYAAMSIGLWSF
jgi:hypothetical protein